MTLADVARAAGVSAITVSRALRNPEQVSPNLRHAILKLVDDLGYVPDFAARTLATKKSSVFAVLVPSMAEYIFMNVMSGIEDCVRPTEYRIQYANSHMDVREEIRQLKLFLGQNPAGIIVSGTEGHVESMELLQKVGCPLVQIMDTGLEPIDMGLGINHFDAGKAAAQHLVDCGYRHIGLLGDFAGKRAERRYHGFHSILAPLGLFDPAFIFSEDRSPSVRGGARLMARLLETAPEIDAVFCRSDDIALGALFECQRRGIRVPEDFGICGFSDLSFANTSVPALTTIRVPRYEMGYCAVGMLLDREKGVQDMPKVVDLGFQLIHRESTRRPKHQD
ncbi:LacI family DNA-binding transcriptional regulator [Agrobacterium sp. ES01]|uniref:LacI family DNA-binding transcriptional regulator n=1 Tax=Agrobacterium sp. ES01 TaxID=3420714 RepID=UPI003D148220